MNVELVIDHLFISEHEFHKKQFNYFCHLATLKHRIHFLELELNEKG